MIDFQNAPFVHLSPIDVNHVAGQIQPLLVEGEQLYLAFQGTRDYIVFTDKRIIAVNIHGLTGKKKHFTSLPYAKVLAFAIETAGMIDLDAELEVWFSELGRVKFEFRGRTDVAYLSRLVGTFVL